MRILSMLAEGEIQADWITKSFPIIRYVLFGIIVVCAITMIVTILLQSNESNDEGNIITGSQESYYSKNKGSTKDGKLKIVTIVMASIIAFCAILYFITEIINKSGS